MVNSEPEILMTLPSGSRPGKKAHTDVVANHGDMFVTLFFRGYKKTTDRNRDVANLSTVIYETPMICAASNV